ncbi:hypothetical protein CWC18_13895 [Pseudoalteromonas aurantia]|uniref:Uncharacterized protein n=1 Tax=Pseudoalteromonas aurantia TaxID=43654 RepID=A0A5S3V027_9GAMM|nr:hypothetical protein CWC18_13895 [Pseudoalteromonas aurantia]TMO63750.1 hypothetical protein CWC19_18905 [Pseudoalteromonas aurantia]TMO73689.1 hypothetical protein CWC20_12560 [Pseudoalteromonas aurantia]
MFMNNTIIYAFIFLVMITHVFLAYKTTNFNEIKFHFIVITTALSSYYLLDLYYNKFMFTPIKGGAPMSIIAIIVLTFFTWLISYMVRSLTKKSNK